MARKRWIRIQTLSCTILPRSSAQTTGGTGFTLGLNPFLHTMHVKGMIASSPDRWAAFARNFTISPGATAIEWHGTDATRFIWDIPMTLCDCSVTLDQDLHLIPHSTRRSSLFGSGCFLSLSLSSRSNLFVNSFCLTKEEKKIMGGRDASELTCHVQKTVLMKTINYGIYP